MKGRVGLSTTLLLTLLALVPHPFRYAISRKMFTRTANSTAQTMCNLLQEKDDVAG